MTSLLLYNFKLTTQCSFYRFFVVLISVEIISHCANSQSCRTIWFSNSFQMQLTSFLVQTPLVKAIFLRMKYRTLLPFVWVTQAHYICIDHWLLWCVCHVKKTFSFTVMSLGSLGFQVSCQFWLNIVKFAQQNAECSFCNW